jgi:hypothetical protein
VALVVKAGTTRPAITHSIITISASPACSACSGDSAIANSDDRQVEAGVDQREQQQDAGQRQVAAVARAHQHVHEHAGHQGQQQQVQHGVQGRAP